MPGRYREHLCGGEQLLRAAIEGRVRLVAELGREEHELLARIAHRSYIDRRTQSEIADEFGLSRPKVQRLLDRARASGVVEVHIEVPMGLDLDLERRLVDTFDLAEAIVTPVPVPTPRRNVPPWRAAAARYLERRLDDGSVVAVSHGRDTGAVPSLLPTGRRPSTACSPAPMGGSPDGRRTHQPQRDLPGARRPLRRAGREPLRPGVRRERRDARPAARAGRHRRTPSRWRPTPTSPWSGSAAPTTPAPWCAADASPSRRSDGYVAREPWATCSATTSTSTERAHPRPTQQPPDRALHRRPASCRHRGGGGERRGEASGDPRCPPRRDRRCVDRGRSQRRSGARPGRSRRWMNAGGPNPGHREAGVRSSGTAWRRSTSSTTCRWRRCSLPPKSSGRR